MEKFLTAILSMFLVALLVLLICVAILQAINGAWVVFVLDVLCLLLYTPSMIMAIKAMIYFCWYD